jgi:glycosyltransferase involved in cell wall biosynthesis
MVDNYLEGPSVSVVLCTYSSERYQHFREAAQSVLEQTYPEVELIVVVDGTKSVFHRTEEDLGETSNAVLHFNEQNRGLLESRNTGAEIASGDIVAFLDDDAVADHQWIEQLVAAFESHQAYAAGGRITPEWVAGEPDFLPEEYYWLIGVTYRGFPEDPGWVRNTFGSNLAFRRKVFLDLGGFDPAIGGRQGDANLQGGETELSTRLQARYDEQVYYDPQAIVEHKIFDYRTKPRWLYNRAFWQGYSKRAMTVIGPDIESEENAFLKQLLVEFIPGRVVGLCRKPSYSGFLQLWTLLFLTSLVGIGYLYGFVRYPGLANS